MDIEFLRFILMLDSTNTDYYSDQSKQHYCRVNYKKKENKKTSVCSLQVLSYEWTAFWVFNNLDTVFFLDSYCLHLLMTSTNKVHNNYCYSFSEYKNTICWINVRKLWKLLIQTSLWNSRYLIPLTSRRLSPWKH